MWLRNKKIFEIFDDGFRNSRKFLNPTVNLYVVYWIVNEPSDPKFAACHCVHGCYFQGNYQSTLKIEQLFIMRNTRWHCVYQYSIWLIWSGITPSSCFRTQQSPEFELMVHLNNMNDLLLIKNSRFAGFALSNLTVRK